MTLLKVNSAHEKMTKANKSPTRSGPAIHRCPLRSPECWSYNLVATQTLQGKNLQYLASIHPHTNNNDRRQAIKTGSHFLSTLTSSLIRPGKFCTVLALGSREPSNVTAKILASLAALLCVHTHTRQLYSLLMYCVHAGMSLPNLSIFRIFDFLSQYT